MENIDHSEVEEVIPNQDDQKDVSNMELETENINTLLHMERIGQAGDQCDQCITENCLAKLVDAGTQVEEANKHEDLGKCATKTTTKGVEDLVEEVESNINELDTLKSRRKAVLAVDVLPKVSCNEESFDSEAVHDELNNVSAKREMMDHDNSDNDWKPHAIPRKKRKCKKKNTAPRTQTKKSSENLINIGGEVKRWNVLRQSLCIRLHEEMAKFLLDWYYASHVNDVNGKTKRRLKRKSSNPVKMESSVDILEDEEQDFSFFENEKELPEDRKDVDYIPEDSDGAEDLTYNNDKECVVVETSFVSKRKSYQTNIQFIKEHFDDFEDDLGSVQCNICCEVVERRAMKTHWAEMHSLEDKSLWDTCIFCDRKMKDKYVHYRSYHKDIWSREKKELKQEKLKKNEENKALKKKRGRKPSNPSGDGIGPVICQYCGKIYEGSKPKRSLSSHIRTVHGSKNFAFKACTYEGCGKSFPSNRINQHMQQHLKPYLCSTCGRSFSSSKDLKNHIKAIHLQLRDIACKWPDCNKKFTMKKHLDVHMRIHTDEKPLKCDRCDYKCRQRAAMNWHVKKHHNGHGLALLETQAHGRPPKPKKSKSESCFPRSHGCYQETGRSNIFDMSQPEQGSTIHQQDITQSVAPFHHVNIPNAGTTSSSDYFNRMAEAYATATATASTMMEITSQNHGSVIHLHGEPHQTGYEYISSHDTSQRQITN